MPDKCKHLCKWKKDEIEKGFVRIAKAVKKPRYLCRRCGRVAGAEYWLCKPLPLKQNQ